MDMSEAEGEDEVSITVSPWVSMKTPCKAMRQEVGKGRGDLGVAAGQISTSFLALLPP